MEHRKQRPSVFPLRKINTIMKSSSKSSNDGHLSKESIVLVAKVTELFIEAITKQCYNEKNGNKLEYNHIMEVVHATPKYSFLSEIVPKKITVLEYKQIMAKKEAEERRMNKTGNSSSDDETSGSSGSLSGSDKPGGTSEEEAAPAGL